MIKNYTKIAGVNIVNANVQKQQEPQLLRQLSRAMWQVTFYCIWIVFFFQFIEVYMAKK